MENIEKCGKAYKCKISRGDRPFEYDFTTAQVNLPNGEVYKICDICGEKCKSNMGIEMHFSTIGHFGFINRGFCHKCSKKYEKLIDEFFDKLADKGGANG